MTEANMLQRTEHYGLRDTETGQAIEFDAPPPMVAALKRKLYTNLSPDRFEITRVDWCDLGGHEWRGAGVVGGHRTGIYVEQCDRCQRYRSVPASDVELVEE